jgi:polyribonucleotide nucleotidyltransferase
MLYICTIIIKQIENMTELQIKQSIEISEKIERKCKLTAVKSKYGMQYTHNIVEETVLNLLRTLWVKTSNKFVKDVVKTVGVSKKISDKQLEIISDELALLSITF